MIFVNSDNSVYLALDTSYEQGVVVLFRGEEILFEQTLIQKYAHAKLVCEALRHAIAVHDDIAGVLCGLGPGSFVGVRVALATALGFSYGRQLPLMGFCSHGALAHTTGHTEPYALFMKASGELGYLTEYQVVRGETVAVSPPRVVAMHVLPSVLARSSSTIFTDYTCGLTALDLPHHRVERIAGPSPRAVMRAALARMHHGFIDESITIKPNYVKDPSVSRPKIDPSLTAAT